MEYFYYETQKTKTLREMKQQMNSQHALKFLEQPEENPA